MDVTQTIILIGSIQGFLLAAIFLARGDGLPGSLLASGLTLISIALFLAYAQLGLEMEKHCYLIKVNIALPLLFIPVLYLYLRSITGSLCRLTYRDLFYFIPATILLLYNLPFYLSQDRVKLEYYYRVDLNGELNLSDSLEDLYINLIILGFTLLAIREVRRYTSRVKEVLTDIYQAKVHWLRFLSWSMFVLVSFANVLAVISLTGTTMPMPLNFVTAICSTLIIYYISYYSLLFPNVFSNTLQELKHVAIQPDTAKEVAHSESNKHRDIALKITLLLEDEQQYKDPHLTLSKLSSQIGLPAYLISKVINTHFDTNFHSLVNNYRLEEVEKRLIDSTPKMSVIEIAFEAGFNTKSTFYNAFKKRTGLAPKQYVALNAAKN